MDKLACKYTMKYYTVVRNRLWLCTVVNLTNVEQKKPDEKEYILYDSIYIKFNENIMFNDACLRGKV